VTLSRRCIGGSSRQRLSARGFADRSTGMLHELRAHTPSTRAGDRCIGDSQRERAFR
jgi:hypothetical protein